MTVLSARTVFLALSHAVERVTAEEWRRLEVAATGALRHRTGKDPAVETGLVGGRLLLSERQESAPEGGLVVTLSRGPRTVDGRLLDARAIAERLARGSVADVAPPFAACTVTDASRSLVAATDSAGLAHLYWVQRDGWAAVSNSSLVLSELVGAGFDAEAIGTSALVGNYLGEETPFRGVRLLGAGATLTMAGGKAAIRHPAASLPQRRLRGADAVADGVEVVRAIVAGCLRAYPEPLLELSGGLDSRMVLAAIPPSRRPRVRAVTVGPAGSADQRIGASIARRLGMPHGNVTLDGIGGLSPRESEELALAAGAQRDCGGNPLALAVLDWQERGLDQGPRLTGQNGEFARGFYYAGQRARDSTTDDLVSRLARWRLFANDAADPALFAPGFLDDARARTIGVVTSMFASYGTDWLAATDEFYLRERMRRWVGVAYSAACARRIVQSPFFHPAYLSWARSLDPTGKRGSTVFAEVLAVLDPGLAALPLDNGRSPRSIAAPSPVDRLTGARTTLRKVVRKVDQRVRGRGRPASGAALLARGVQAAWAEREDALERVSTLPFLEGSVVEQVARGERAVNPASVGLLVNLDAALR